MRQQAYHWTVRHLAERTGTRIRSIILDMVDTLGLFHLKVWGGGGRNGRFFEGGEGPNSELIFPIRFHIISGRRGAEFLITFRSSPPPHF